MAAAPRSLKARALQWLAQREQSRSELRRKLMPYARAEDAALVADGDDAAPGEVAAMAAISTDSASVPAPARVDALLDWLEAHRFLSQERFAESRVHARAPRFGNLRIRQELKQHQVTLSPDAAKALAETEASRAATVRERKFGALPETPAERAKQARFLAGRGFSPDAIGHALRRSARSDAADVSAPIDD